MAAKKKKLKRTALKSKTDVSPTKKKKGRKPYTDAQKVEANKIHRANQKIKRIDRSAHDKALERELKTVGSRNKEIREADLRLRLGGAKVVDKINWIVDEFTILDNNIRKVRNTEEDPRRLARAIQRSSARGKLLKTQAAILFRKLDKLVPDIKSIDHSGIFKPTKTDTLPEDKMLDILKGAVPLEELKAMFPQYENIMKELEDMDMPDLAN